MSSFRFFSFFTENIINKKASWYCLYKCLPCNNQVHLDLTMSHFAYSQRPFNIHFLL